MKELTHNPTAEELQLFSDTEKIVEDSKKKIEDLKNLEIPGKISIAIDTVVTKHNKPENEKKLKLLTDSINLKQIIDEVLEIYIKNNAADAEKKANNLLLQLFPDRIFKSFRPIVRQYANDISKLIKKYEKIQKAAESVKKAFYIKQDIKKAYEGSTGNTTPSSVVFNRNVLLDHDAEPPLPPIDELWDGNYPPPAESQPAPRVNKKRKFDDVCSHSPVLVRLIE